MSRDNWTDDELRRIVEGRGRGETFDEIARAIGRTKSGCIAKLARCVEDSFRFEVPK